MALSGKEKRKRKGKKYWRLLEPKKYVDLMFSFVLPAKLKKLAKRSELKEVELKGVLKQTDEGFVYVKINNDIIHGLFPLIDEDGIEEPPYFGKGEIGAHIYAISDEEIDEDVEIKELGQEINFKLGSMCWTKPEGWKEMAKVFFVSVEIPELKEIRKRYGLPVSYKGLGHDYHTTIAVKKAKK